VRLLIAAVIVVATARADAYPQFQLSSGTVQCAQCHLAPAGGGLLTQWGREEGADTLSLGGNGQFLHGAVELPEWIAIGGDVRVAALANETGSDEGTELAWFPMQADLGVHAGTEQLSFTAVVGFRGAVRSGSPNAPPSDPPAGDAMSPALRSYFVARELYGMWRAEPQSGPYVRAGRFAAPYGLRLADHTAYVRRYLGFNLLEETLGVGGGTLGDGWELHATGFVFDPLQGATRREYGGAVMFEAQPTDLALGASARVGRTADDMRLQVGVHGKLWIEPAKLMLQAEVDGVHQTFAAGGNRNQLAAYVGPVLVPARGLYTGVAYEAFAEDLRVQSVLRQALGVWLSVLPRAHWEVMLSGRGQRIGPHEHALVGLLQLHYYL
jgi:hypothetical protein